MIQAYLAYSAMAMKERLAFRFNFLTSLFLGFFYLLLVTSVWKAVYVGQSRLAGYGREAILFYAILAGAMKVAGLMGVGSRFGERAASGEVETDLTRPVSLPWALFFADLGDFSLRFWTKLLPTFFVGLLLIGRVPPLFWHHVLVALVLFLGGNFLHFWLDLAAASFAFRTKSGHGITILWSAVTALLSGLVVPIPFYPPALQQVVLWTPFPSVAYTPIRVLMADTSVTGGVALLFQRVFGLPDLFALAAEQLVWVLVVQAAAGLVYRWNQAALEVQGG